MHTSPLLTHRRGFTIIEIVVVIAVLLMVGFAAFFLTQNKHTSADKSQSTQSMDNMPPSKATTSSSAVEVGQYLSHNQCTGEGSKKLGSAPMRTSDIGVILPYGLMAGGHVTPVDHQYFYGKNQKAAPSTYDVLSPASGTLVNIEVRPKATGPADVRGVISYSCTFFSYFDLANDLSEEIAAKMPSNWKTINGPQKVFIPVTQGQVLAKVGGQSLDFAVWDTTSTLSGLLEPKAYNNYEPWKIHTVKPTDFYTESVTASLLPFYVRQAAPRDGVLAYDQDDKAVGSWFKQGTNGYIGAFAEKDFNPMIYASGHLALAPDYLDPEGWVFSTGATTNGSQFGIASPSVAPSALTKESGVVKYTLVQYEHVDETGAMWLGNRVPKSITLSTSGAVLGTALVQLMDARLLKVEVFMGNTPAQVSAFSSNAAMYTRGAEATTMTR